MKDEHYDVLNVEGGRPVKMWTRGVPVEDEAKRQLENVARMPFVFSHVAAMPDVPTTAELGYPKIFIGHWSGVFAPRGTPEAILDKMNKAIDAALKSPELRARLIPQGIQPMGGTRADFTRFLADEKARLGPIARAANMKED